MVPVFGAMYEDFGATLPGPTQVLVAISKWDVQARPEAIAAATQMGATHVLGTSAVTGQGIEALRQQLIATAPEDFINAPAIVGDLVPAGGLVVLVILPILLIWKISNILPMIIVSCSNIILAVFSKLVFNLRHCSSVISFS